MAQNPSLADILREDEGEPANLVDPSGVMTLAHKLSVEAILKDGDGDFSPSALMSGAPTQQLDPAAFPSAPEISMSDIDAHVENFAASTVMRSGSMSRRVFKPAAATKAPAGPTSNGAPVQNGNSGAAAADISVDVMDDDRPSLSMAVAADMHDTTDTNDNVDEVVAVWPIHPAPSGAGASPAGAEPGEEDAARIDIDALVAETDGLVTTATEVTEPGAQTDFEVVSPIRAVSKYSRDTRGILRLDTLSGISARLAASGADNRRDMGLPTVIRVSQNIYIGTSHGLVLVFDKRQHLLQVIGRSNNQDLGPVTALDVSQSADAPDEWLAVGHHNGHIVVWDRKHERQIKTLADSHTTPVMHLFFLADRMNIISAELKGTVMLNTLSRVLLVWLAETQCLVNGDVGQVQALAPLYPTAGARHPADALWPVAMCTQKKIIVFQLKPKVGMLYKQNKPDGVRPSALPHVSWREAMLSDDDKSNQRLLDPILAVAWGRQINVLQMYMRQGGDDRVEFINIGQYETDTDITGFRWLGSKVLSMVNRKEQVRVFDPFALQELESVDVRGVGLIYHTKYSATATMPNADTVTGAEVSHQNSFVTADRRFFLLGLNSVATAAVLTWLQRISSLVQAGDFLSALALALDFYEGTAHAAVGLPRDPAKIKEITAGQIVQLLAAYVDIALSTFVPSGDITADLAYFQGLGGICIDYSLPIDRSSTIIAHVYDKLEAAGYGRVLLELLEPYILGDKLKTLNPRVMQAFVEHYRNNGMLRRVEQCIMHMNIASLDFHQVVKLCQQFELYSALIYMFNMGLANYVGPLEELMAVIQPALTEDGKIVDENKRQIGYKMLLYISYCFAGKAFPRGEVDSGRLPSVKREMVDFLCAPGHGGQFYPNMHLLMCLDASEFLRVLTAAFLDKGLFGEPSSKDSSDWVDVTADTPGTSPPRNMTPQRERARSRTGSVLGTHSRVAVTDALLTVVCGSSLQGVATTLGKLTPQAPFTALHAWHIAVFIAGQVAAKQLAVPPVLMESILLQLSQPTTTVPHGVGSLDGRETPPDVEERQDLVLRCLQASRTSRIPTGKLVHVAEESRFFRVCELIYNEQRNFERVLDCYLQDPHRRNAVFGTIKALMVDPSLSAEEHEVVRTWVLSRLQNLIQVNSDASSQLILDSFADNHEEVVARLKPYPELLFVYYRQLMDGKRKEKDRDDTAPASRVGITSEMEEQYIELMCRFRPEAVTTYLLGHDNYRFETALNIVKTYNLTDATVHLLERMGDAPKAFALLLGNLDVALQKLFVAVKMLEGGLVSPVHGMPPCPEATEYRRVLGLAIALCQRNSQRLDDTENQPLWFLLLDRVVLPLRQLKREAKRRKETDPSVGDATAEEMLTQGLTHYTSEVLDSMMGHIALPSILQKIVDDHSKEELGEFKSVIMGILDTYRYEEVLLSTTNRLLGQDIHRAFAKELSTRKQNFRPRQLRCSACSRGFTGGATASKDIKVFRCGHSFHNACAQKNTRCPTCHDDDNKPAAGPSAPRGKEEDTGESKGRGDAQQYLRQLDKFAVASTSNRVDLETLLRVESTGTYLPPPEMQLAPLPLGAPVLGRRRPPATRVLPYEPKCVGVVPDLF